MAQWKTLEQCQADRTARPYAEREALLDQQIAHATKNGTRKLREEEEQSFTKQRSELTLRRTARTEWVNLSVRTNELPYLRLAAVICASEKSS